MPSVGRDFRSLNFLNKINMIDAKKRKEDQQTQIVVFPKHHPVLVVLHRLSSSSESVHSLENSSINNEKTSKSRNFLMIQCFTFVVQQYNDQFHLYSTIDVVHVFVNDRDMHFDSVNSSNIECIGMNLTDWTLPSSFR